MFEHIAHPDSVCHQCSITGMFNIFSSHSYVGGSRRSPAKNTDLRQLISYFSFNTPSGSSFFTARNAVGAVKNVFTLCVKNSGKRYSATSCVYYKL